MIYESDEIKVLNEVYAQGFEEGAEACVNDYESVALLIKNIEAEADAIRAEVANMTARRKEKERYAEYLREALRRSLTVADVPVFETARVRLSFRRTSSVNVYDMEALPEEYKRVKTDVEPDKDKIKNDIKNGVIVDGAELVTERKLILR